MSNKHATDLIILTLFSTTHKHIRQINIPSNVYSEREREKTHYKKWGIVDLTVYRLYIGTYNLRK